MVRSSKEKEKAENASESEEMTISVTVRTTKENGASVEEIRGAGGTKTNIPKDSERLFHVWGEGFIIVREEK
jgi:predicted lactoylglutathione lyase